MTLVAYGSIEQQSDGRWICRRASVIEGRYGQVSVLAGQVFPPSSFFAGYGNFTAHLAAIAVEQPIRLPHEWA